MINTHLIIYLKNKLYDIILLEGISMKIKIDELFDKIKDQITLKENNYYDSLYLEDAILSII